MAEVVRLEIGQEKRFKIKYRHRDLRDVVEKTGKSIGDLFGDPFGGWPYLLLYGRRFENPRMTLDDASNLIDEYIGEGGEFSKIGELLTKAMELSGYIKFEQAKPEEDETESGDAAA